MRNPNKWDELEKAAWAPTVSDETRRTALAVGTALRLMNFPEPGFVCVCVGDGEDVLASWEMGQTTVYLRVAGGDVSWSWHDDYW